MILGSDRPVAGREHVPADPARSAAAGRAHPRAATGRAPARTAAARARRRSPLVAVSFLVAALASIGGLAGSPSPAAAAEPGPGYSSPGRPLDHLGAYLAADGTTTYCIDVGEPSAVGAVSTEAGTVDQVNGLTNEEMRELSFVLTAHGATTDDRTAAAVAMVVWGIAGPSAYRSIGGDAAVLTRAPESERAAIQGLADRFRTEASDFTPVTPRATLSLSIDQDDEYAGSLDVSVTPASARGTVTLTNAVFADSGLSIRPEVTDGDHLAIVAVPPVDPGLPADATVESAPYRVEAGSDDFTARGEPSGTVRLFITPGAQTLVAASALTPTVFGAAASDGRDRAVPTLATLAQATGVVGGTIRDSSFVEDVPSSGLQLSWSAYLQPPTATDPVCTPETLVFATDAPLPVTVDGTYLSAAFTVADAHVGTIHWVGTVVRGTEVVARGRCGDPAERTVVTPAPPRLPVVSG